MNLDRFKTVEQLATAMRTMISGSTAITSPEINVVNYGATGNGSTNDYAAIQAAIDDLADGGSLVFPDGNYYYTTVPAFTTLNSIRIHGDGILKPDTCNGLKIDDCEDVIIENLRIQGIQSGNTYIGIEITSATGNCRHVEIKSCHLSGFQTGIKITDSSNSVGNTRIHDNWIELDAGTLSGSTGIIVEDPDNKIYNNTIQRYVEGIALDAGSQLVAENHIWGASGDGKTCCIAVRRGYTSNAGGYSIVGNYLDGYSSDAHLVINCQGARQVAVTGNYFRVSEDIDQIIEFENGGSTVDAQGITIVGNQSVNASGQPCEFLTLTGVQTNDSEHFHVHSNTFGSDITPYSTRDDVRQVVTYTTPYTPNPMLGRMVEMTLTGNVSVNVPSSTDSGGIGNRMTFLFIQDGTGGRTVSFGGNYNTTWSDANNIASAQSSITFEFAGGSTWNEVAYSPYPSEWTEYSSTSTIVGWSSYTTQEIWYKTDPGGKTYVQFHLGGTSNSTSVTFTLKDAHNGDMALNAVARGNDNGGSYGAIRVNMSASSSTVTVYSDMGTGTWTNSGSKNVMGQFTYQT